MVRRHEGRWLSVPLLAVLLLAACQPAGPSAKSADNSASTKAAYSEEDAARHFGGKTITFTVGFAPGGGFDTFARIVAAHIPKHIPGNPTVAVANVPGANSLSAAQSILRKTPGDGLDVLVFHSGLIVQQVLGQKLEGFDMSTPVYLGLPDVAPSKAQMCVRSDIATSLDAFLKSPSKLKVGDTAAQTGPGALIEWFTLVGLPVEGVYGYGGTSEVRLAFDRGELGLTKSCGDVDIPAFPHWFDQGKATPLFHWGEPPDFMRSHLAEGKYPWYKHVLEIVSVTPAQRGAFEINQKISAGQRVFALPPRTPDNTVTALRQAFDKTVNDPAFQQDIVQRNYEFGLRSASQMQELIDELNALPPDVVEVLKQMWKVNG